MITYFKHSSFILSLAVFAMSAFMVGCGGGGDSDLDQVVQQEKENNLKQVSHDIQEVQKLFYMMPSPVEIASMLKKAGADYNPALLNDLRNISNYATTREQALNLGVYGSDLSYASIFDATQDVMFYVKACKGLADDLGISKAFDANTMARVEENIDNPDSMLFVISDSYWLADAYLKEHERAMLSALIITGGWVEGLYIATQLVDPEDSGSALGQQVADQKLSLEHLIKLITTYKDEPELKGIFEDLEGLMEIYAELEEAPMKKGVTTGEDGVMTITGAKKLVVTKEQIIKIKEKVEAIRTSFI